MISFPLCLTCEAKVANRSGYCEDHQPEDWVEPVFDTFEEELIFHLSKPVNPNQKYLRVSGMTFTKPDEPDKLTP